ncbi:MAG TPA: response regulator [Candidatus Binatia bacterium]|nr:response regulator [Candidatus Binatia bacterium]
MTSLSEPETDTSKPHILVVDDEMSPRESLKMILNPYYTVHVAECGAEAVEMLDKVPIDLVTLDLKMPDLSGIHVLEKLKEYDPDIEAIIITAHSSQDTAVQGLRLGAFDYIAKPFDVNHILSVVRRGLERRNAKTKSRDIKSYFSSKELWDLANKIAGPDFLSKESWNMANKITAFAVAKDCALGVALGLNFAGIHDQTLLTKSLLAIVAIVSAMLYSFGVVLCYRWAMSIDKTREILWRQATYGRISIICLFTLVPVVGLYGRYIFVK